MANLDLAVARIRNRAIQLPADKREAYVAENITHQQQKHWQYVHGWSPPGWSSDASLEYIRRLIDLQQQFREAELEAA